MNWFDYFQQILVLGTFVWILKTIFFRPKSKKTQRLEVNDDLADKNKADERINTESSSENSYENLTDSEPSEAIADTTDSYENQECYETCNNVSYKNENQEKINMTNVLECSGYGTTEEEIQNVKLNISNNSQHNLDTRNSVLEIIPRDSIQRKNSNFFEHYTSLGTEIDLQNSNLESTEDEGNESQLGSSQEELKKKTFFFDRRHKNVKKCTSIETDDFENNENAQSLTKKNTDDFHQNDSINNENNFSFDSSNSRSEEENYSNLKNYYGYTTLEMLNKFTCSDESDNCSHLLKYSRSLPSSIHSDDSSFQNMKFTHSNESQEVSDSSSYSSSLPSSIHSYDCSLQNMQFKEDCDVSFISSAASNDNLNVAFIEEDIKQE